MNYERFLAVQCICNEAVRGLLFFISYLLKTTSMKDTLRYTVLVVLIVTLGNLKAQTNSTGTITTEIVSLLTAEETAFLQFGKLTSLTQDGDVQVTPQGERVTSGDIMLVNDEYSAGVFIVKASRNSVVSVVLPQNAQTLYNTQNSNKLTVDGWKSNVPAEGVLVNSDNGKVEVNIGATLRIHTANDSPSGYYTGSYQVTFMYN